MGNCFTHHKTRLFITKSQLLEIFPKMNVLPLVRHPFISTKFLVNSYHRATTKTYQKSKKFTAKTTLNLKQLVLPKILNSCLPVYYNKTEGMYYYC